MLSHKAKCNIQKNSSFVNKKPKKSLNLKKLFEQKNSCLSKFYEFIPPLTFLEENFLSILGTVENKKIISCDLLFDDILLFFERNDFYIYYQEYRNNFVSKKTLSFIRFLIVDIDKIQSYQRFIRVIKKIQQLKIKPSYILNSGNGIHLIFGIEKVKYIKELDDLYLSFQKKIQEEIGAEVDIHGFVQPYRLPGSLTKFFERTTLWKVGTKKHKIKDIEAFLAEEKKEIVEEKQEKEIQRQKQKQKNIKYFPSAGQNFWTWFCEKAEDVQVGHRYMYMFSIAIVAYKSRVPKEIVEKKLKDVQERFNDRDPEKIKDCEIEKAMCGYSQKFVRVKWETISRWTGIEKERNTKRNRRSRKEHLGCCNAIRSASSNFKAKQAVKLVEKGYSKTEIAKILGVSRQHVYRLLKLKQ